MTNFFGFPKPRQAGFGSPDIPSVDIPPLDTTHEDVVLEGVIVDFGNLNDVRPGMFDPLATTSLSSEDMNAFLMRMMGVDSPVRYTQDDVSGTILVDTDAVEVMDVPAEVPEPSVEDAESVEDRLTVMGNENEKLQSFITDAMKNMKK